MVKDWTLIGYQLPLRLTCFHSSRRGGKHIFEIYRWFWVRICVVRLLKCCPSWKSKRKVHPSFSLEMQGNFSTKNPLFEALPRMVLARYIDIRDQNHSKRWNINVPRAGNTSKHMFSEASFAQILGVSLTPFLLRQKHALIIFNKSWRKFPQEMQQRKFGRPFGVSPKPCNHLLLILGLGWPANPWGNAWLAIHAT